MKVLMLPQLRHFRSEESGIKRVVEAYHKYAPQFGIEYVDENEPYDLKVSHAGTNTENIDVAHLHGLYWSADVSCSKWEWKANANVIEAARQAKTITVPSEWVAETIRRDMRRQPVVIGHGVDWDDWQHDRPMGGYILYNKNRQGDVCDASPVLRLAVAYTDLKFVTTFAHGRKRNNMEVTGVIPHEQMRQLVQGAAVYLATTKETFGIGTLEAMAAGVPVLGFAHGGNNELVEHGVNGYMAEPDNYDDLIEGLDYCLSHRNVLGENGRELAREYTWERAMKLVADTYEKALCNGPSTVSVIIPSYMYADQVGRAIKSVMRQTCGEIKDIVVVDDGSPDDGATRAVVEELMQHDTRIGYLSQQNSGVAVARNTGIASVDTDYVCCLDADDAMEPGFIEECVRALDADNSLGIAYTGLRYILPDGKTGVSPWPKEWNFDDQLERKNQVPTCCVYRRSMWEALGGYKKRYCPIGAGSEDAEFWTRSGAYGWKGAKVTEKPLFIYSWQSGRVSGNKDYQEPDWLAWHPWAFDKRHPFASYATPKQWSHPVRQYDDPVVSVVVPVGPGHHDSLEDALDSIEAQTYRKWECIVVWDREDEIPERYVNAYPYVVFRRTFGKGAGYARNHGVEFSRAPFLLFLDADDWLYPSAIEKMMDAWIREESVVYSDYVGKAFIEDPTKLSSKLQTNIEWRMPDGLTAIKYEAPSYDVAKAQNQPHGDPAKVYTWNLITSLVPRVWHDEINGFDESMESWEDVDYWWRIAKRGHCFTKIDEPLVVYHFYTGERREFGKEQHQRLFQYLIEKHDKEEVVACRGCGSRRAVTKPTATPAARVGPVNVPMTLSDEQFKLIEYRHPNRGQHTVVGQAVFQDKVDGVHMVKDGGNNGWRIHYGFRGGGDRFLAHVEDIRIAGHLFSPIETRPAPQIETGPPPAPRSLVTDSGPPEVDEQDGRTPEPRPIDVDALMESVEPPLTADGGLEQIDRHIEWQQSGNGFDLQKLPGMTSKIAEQMNGMTLEDIVQLGEDALQEDYKGIGPSRAKAIYNAALERISA